MGKTLKIIITVLIICGVLFAVWFFGYNSTDNRFKRLQVREILDWYCGASIKLYDFCDNSITRSENEKQELIKLQKAVKGLDNNWDFEFENIEIKNIDSYSHIIDLLYVFRNKESNELKYFTERYYYDSTTSRPVSLLNKNWLMDDNLKYIGETSYRSLWDENFNDYRNLKKKFIPTNEKEIKNLNDNLLLENYNEFGKLTLYYLPDYLIDAIEYKDIDQDSTKETIIFYSCRGCNALSRQMDIIKDNEIIFTAEGGNLSLESLKKEKGFYLNTSIVPRGLNMHTRVKFIKNIDGEFHPQSEDVVEY